MVVDSELVLVFAENAERTVSELLNSVSPSTLVEKKAVLTSSLSTKLAGNSCDLFVVLNSRIRTCVMEFILMAMYLRLTARVAVAEPTGRSCPELMVAGGTDSLDLVPGLACRPTT
jgi:hypothetical protein